MEDKASPRRAQESKCKKSRAGCPAMAVLIAQDVLSMASVLWLSAAVRLPLPLLAAPPGELWKATARGFEPLRAEPNGFRVHLLSRSDTLSWLCSSSKASVRKRQGLSPGERRSRSAKSPEQGAPAMGVLLAQYVLSMRSVLRLLAALLLPFLCLLSLLEGSGKRQRGDSNPCGQSPMDFKSISLTARTQCRVDAPAKQDRRRNTQKPAYCSISGLVAEYIVLSPM